MQPPLALTGADRSHAGLPTPCVSWLLSSSMSSSDHARRTLEIWMLDDGTPGHWSMTEGLVRLFSEHRDLRTRRIPIHWRPRSARQLFQYAERLGMRVPDWICGACIDMPMPKGEIRPDLIVSRGGSTLFPNAWLARRYRAPNVFIGTLRGMPESNFRTVIVQRDEEDRAPYFTLPLAPTRLDPRTLAAKSADFPWSLAVPEAPCACLFLGGDGSGHFYRDDDWRALAAGITHFHRVHGVSWCVSSSRRTPPAAESLLRSLVPAEAIHEACWWHEGDRRPCLDAFLGAAQIAFCTSDSMSMLEECAASALPVIALAPHDANPPERYRAFLSRREKAGRIKLMQIREFADDPGYPVVHDWHPVRHEDMAEAALRLLGILEL